MNYIKLKMKKENDGNLNKNSTPSKQSAKKHSRGNSDFSAAKPKNVKHVRRRSDGLS